MAINALNNQLEAQFSTDFTLTSSNLASSILVLIDILVTQENPEKLKQNTFFQSIFQRVTFLSSRIFLPNYNPPGGPDEVVSTLKIIK